MIPVMDIRPYREAVDTLKLRVEGIIVLQRGEKIGEHRWIPEKPRNVFSVSKSVTAVALGMALDDGTVSLDQRVIDSFPGLAPKPSPRLQSLTLRHLLTMTRGHGGFTRPSSVEEALSHELHYDPGAVFVYDNACTLLISAMITNAAGMNVRELLLKRLFPALGIPGPLWPESGGVTQGATGLELSTGSLALFGQFLLQRGNWNGKQLVSSRWIDGATRTQVPTRNPRLPETCKPDYDLGYGFHFWTCRHGAYRADGKNGQFVVVLPREEAVVAINADEAAMNPILYAVWDHILPRLSP
ncbi:MAG: beta-lactamase family protein [Spirochaetaceae bacterium]|jgi:CubicO group peptidase (beta-lactamase class C family)|nr:beta-lactamase family protein [Spirochaetaceae bacterium]